MRTATVGLMLRPHEDIVDVVRRMKKVDAWDAVAHKAVPTVHREGFRFLSSDDPEWLGRVEWEADVP